VKEQTTQFIPGEHSVSSSDYLAPPASVIPGTLQEWKPILPLLLDEIFGREVLSSVSVFGSTKYVDMVRAAYLDRCQSDLFYIGDGRANTPALAAALVRSVVFANDGNPHQENVSAK
jgi:hypothetical protein